jgi:hypothetical protein
MLLFKGGIFMQLLEGPKEAVQNLYGRIATDLRHNHIKLVVKRMTDHRIFDEWSMAYKEMDNIDLDMINTILPWKDLVDKTYNGEIIPTEDIITMLKKFRFKVTDKENQEA